MPEPVAFLFDMDGVVVDSNPVHVETWIEYNRRSGVETNQGMIDRMYGKRNDEIIRDFLGDHLTDSEVFEHGAAKERLYREFMKPQLEGRVLPGLRAFLTRHRGVKTGLATNAERSNVELVLSEAGLAQYFEVVVDGHQVERPKPFPDIYLKAAALLGTDPSRCIVFEDSYTGVAAARAAQMSVVAVRTTHHDFEDVEFQIDDFRDPQLEAWLSTNWLNTRS